MFGNAPKALWARWITPDERNRIPLACRCLLVQEEGRTILFETGVGAFFNPKMADRFGIVEREHVLLDNLAKLGFSHEDIDIIVLSHLHFDHVGGLLSPWSEGEPSKLLFPNAQFICGEEAWERAQNPHPRDRASFIPELNEQLAECGRLERVRGDYSETLGQDYRFHRSEGHTPGLLLSEIKTSKGPVVFAADLIPGVPWVHLPITMGYDRYPERLIDEKRALLGDLVARGGHLFYTHDPKTALSRVTQDERGRFVAEAHLEEIHQWG